MGLYIRLYITLKCITVIYIYIYIYIYIQYLLWNIVQKFEGSEIFLKGNIFFCKDAFNESTVAVKTLFQK